MPWVLAIIHEIPMAGGWIHVLEESGFTIMDIETGPIRLIKNLTILEDEAAARAATFAWSLATQDEKGECFHSSRKVLESYEIPWDV